jgi:hypothetical protein
MQRTDPTDAGRSAAQTGRRAKNPLSQILAIARGGVKTEINGLSQVIDLI